ncbi:hypothetical protein [Bacillus sp. ISL-57]|uniref:hypothetical protein n=1 Tax=Bacillus sp. ISL-57 TaxID=2819135 RepID=UPI002034B697|nr:hypothetical protein [Bacillus sp. ISL-57]
MGNDIVQAYVFVFQYTQSTCCHGSTFIEPNKRSGTLAASVEQCHINDSKQKKDSATND